MKLNILLQAYIIMKKLDKEDDNRRNAWDRNGLAVISGSLMTIPVDEIIHTAPNIIADGKKTSQVGMSLMTIP